VIKSFKHKGIKKYFESGSTAGIQNSHARKLEMPLVAMDTAHVIEDIDLPGYQLHSLRGDREGIWSISVNGHWRITFEFKDGNAYILNYEDYH
jgi:proteic killer suppression protein